MRRKDIMPRVSIVALLAVVASSCCPTPLPCPIPIPPEQVDVTGDGELLAHPVGRHGGTLRLGPGAAPALFVPDGAMGDEGLVISMRKVEGGRAGGASGMAVSEPFEVSPPVEARIPHAFTFSARVAELPAGCAREQLRFAVERPNDVGPADGRGSPTLRWEYDRVAFGGDIVAGVVPTIHGNRMQFVCLNEGTP
jgi:hypothetical protein